MVGWKRRSLALLVCLYQVVQMVLQGIKDGLDIRDHKNQSHSMTVMYSHSFHRAGAAHPHPPHRVRAPPHLEFGRSPSGCGVENDCQCDVWVTLYYPLYPCLAPVHVNVQAPARGRHRAMHVAKCSPDRFHACWRDFANRQVRSLR